MRILFLRKATCDVDDPYIARARSEGFEGYSFSPIKISELPHQNLLDHLSQLDKFDGIIITSVSTVNILKKFDSIFNKWLPVFVVGKATGAAVRDVGFTDIHGENSGDAIRLAPIISEYYKDALSQTRLLFPGANTKIGGLAGKIHPIEVVEIPVYETSSRSHAELQSELSDIPAVDFVVFFSPSGVKAALDVIKLHSPSSSCVAIGPTTAKYLDSPIASKTPDVTGLFDAILCHQT